jgi:spermidine/putrescine transport system permease protein
MASIQASSTARPAPAARVGRMADRWLLPLYVVGVTAYLILPVAVMILFSFNDPTGRSNLNWREFSIAAWLNPLGRPGLSDAVRNSLLVALVSTVVATAFGTMIGLALARYTFRGRAMTNLLVFLPMSTPEIVLGASLLTTFVASTQLPIPQGLVFPLSIRTILIAHIMFNISYVVVTVKARLIGFDRHLEEAAMDLGANGWTTFWRVTMPLIAPGILAALLLTFALSVDDFVITNFNAGTTVTFPLFVWGAARAAVFPQINVIGTAIFAVAIITMLANIVFQNRRSRRTT